jgi:hypothetical protein
MVVGIAVASVLTAAIASRFVRDERESETTYRWYGRAGGRWGRWLCVSRTADERNSTFKIRVLYGGRVYYCKR